MQQIYSLALRRLEGFSSLAAALWVAQGNIWRGQWPPRLPLQRALSATHAGVTNTHTITHRLSINSPFGHFYSRVRSPGDVSVVPPSVPLQRQRGDENVPRNTHWTKWMRFNWRVHNTSNLAHVLPKHRVGQWHRYCKAAMCDAWWCDIDISSTADGTSEQEVGGGFVKPFWCLSEVQLRTPFCTKTR